VQGAGQQVAGSQASPASASCILELGCSRYCLLSFLYFHGARSHAFQTSLLLARFRREWFAFAPDAVVNSGLVHTKDPPKIFFLPGCQTSNGLQVEFTGCSLATLP
jgi:hypothetical protein